MARQKSFIFASVYQNEPDLKTRFLPEVTFPKEIQKRGSPTCDRSSDLEHEKTAGLRSNLQVSLIIRQVSYLLSVMNLEQDSLPVQDLFRLRTTCLSLIFLPMGRFRFRFSGRSRTNRRVPHHRTANVSGKNPGKNFQKKPKKIQKKLFRRILRFFTLAGLRRPDDLQDNRDNR